MHHIGQRASTLHKRTCEHQDGATPFCRSGSLGSKCRPTWITQTGEHRVPVFGSSQRPNSTTGRLLLLDNGTVNCWGLQNNGMEQRWNEIHRNPNIQFWFRYAVDAAGDSHTCVILDDGTVVEREGGCVGPVRQILTDGSGKTGVAIAREESHHVVLERRHGEVLEENASAKSAAVRILKYPKPRRSDAASCAGTTHAPSLMMETPTVEPAPASWAPVPPQTRLRPMRRIGRQGTFRRSAGYYHTLRCAQHLTGRVLGRYGLGVLGDGGFTANQDTPGVT